MYCRNALLAFIQRNSGTEGIVTYIHGRSDTQWLTLILGSHLETPLTVWILDCAKKKNTCLLLNKKAAES